MPINLSQELEIEKNRVELNVWLVLIEMSNRDASSVLRIVSNNEDITYNGNTFVALDFEIDDIPQPTKGQIPTFNLKISNVDKIVQGYVESDVTFMSGWGIKLMVVSGVQIDSNNNVTSTPEIEHTFTILNCNADEKYVTFSIGRENPLKIQFPTKKYSTGFCQHNFNDGIGCDYTNKGYLGRYANFFEGMTKQDIKDNFVITTHSNSKDLDTGNTQDSYGLVTDGYDAINDFWVSGGLQSSRETSGFWKIDFKSGRILEAFEFKSWEKQNFGRPDSASPTDFNIEGSNDNTNWTILQRYNINNEDYFRIVFGIVSNKTAYRYYRFNFTSKPKFVYAVCYYLRNLKLYGRDGLRYTTCNKTLLDCKKRFNENRTNSNNEKIGLPILIFKGINRAIR